MFKENENKQEKENDIQIEAENPAFYMSENSSQDSKSPYKKTPQSEEEKSILHISKIKLDQHQEIPQPHKENSKIPPSPIIPDKKEKKSETKNKESILTIVYSFLFIIVVFAKFNIYDRYKVYNSLSNYFRFPSTGTVELRKSDVIAVFNRDLNDLILDNFWLLDYKYGIFSNLRFTSRRSKLLSSNSFVPYNGINSTYFAADSISYDSEFNPELEESDPYNGNVFSKDTSYLGKGGYVVKINSNITPNKTADELGHISSAMKSQFSNLLSDSQVKSVVMDFLIANYELGYIMPAIITFNFDSTGIVTINFNLYILDGKIYENFSGVIKILLDVVSFIIYVGFLIFIIIKIMKKVNSKYERFSKIYNYNNSKGESCNLQILSSTVNKNKIPSRIFILLDYLQKNMSLIIQIISIILSIISSVIWAIYIFGLFKYFTIIANIFNSDSVYQLEDDAHNKMIYLSYSLETYRSIVTINFLFILLRNIEVISYYFPSTKIFLKTLSDAMSDLLSFFVLFITLLLGFSFFTFFFYFRYLPNFSNFFYSVQQNLSFIMGSIDFATFDNMSDYNETIALLYFLLIVYFLKYILTKIVLAIIFYYFKIALDEFEGKEIEAKKRQIYTKEKLGRSKLLKVFFYAKNILRKIFEKLCYYLGKIFPQKKKELAKSNKIEIKVEGKELPTNFNLKQKISYSNEIKSLPLQLNSHISKEIKDIRLFNMEYNSDYYFFLRTPYFDSQKDEAKLKIYYEQKYKKVLLSCLIFGVFIASLISSVLLQTNTPWRGKFYNALSDLLNNPSTNSNAEQYQLKNLNSQEDLKTFVFDLLPSYFAQLNQQSFKDFAGSSSFISQTTNDRLLQGDNLTSTTSNQFFLLNSAELIQNKIMLTVKKLNSQFQNTPSESMWSRFLDTLSLSSPMKDEAKLTGNIDDVSFEYNYDQSYRNLGGYTQILDLAQFQINSTKYISQPVQDFLIDPLSTYIIAEFILYNAEYKFMAYVDIIIEYDYGTFYQNNLNTYIFKRNFVDSNLDYIKYIAELIFFFMLVYQIYFFITSTIKQIKSYNKWYVENVKKLSLKTQEIREYHTPEPIRKVYSIFNFYKVYQFFILILSVTLIVIRIKLFFSENKIRNLFLTDEINTLTIYQVRDMVYSAVDDNKIFQMIGVITIFISSLQLIVMLRFGKYFFLLIKTMDDSKSNYFKFLIIFLFVHLAFIFYSHFSFGIKEFNYRLTNNVIMLSFNMMFGNLDWQIYNAGNPIFGPIFFFLFVFIMNMILLNLFFAIVDSSYVKVNYEIKETIERWSIVRVFLSCISGFLGKKKVNFEKEEHKRIEMEFQNGKLIEVDPSFMKMDVRVNRMNFQDWMEEEIENILVLDQKLNENKKKLEKIENGYNSGVAGEYNIFANDVYRNVSEEQYSCYHLSYIADMLEIAEKLERDVIKIEEYKEHITSYEEFSELMEEADKLKGKYTSLYPESLKIKEKIASNLLIIEQMRKDLEELNNINSI